MFNLNIITKLKILSLMYAKMRYKFEPYIKLGEKIIPDLSLQHTEDIKKKLTEFDILKKRNQQAFQVKFAHKNINKLNGYQSMVDIGDSSGSHLLQLKELCKTKSLIFINIDNDAVRE